MFIGTSLQRKLLVMERIYGIPVTNMGDLEAAGVDLKILAERGVEIFFTQVFEHNFFHADMHPGNIFIEATNPQDPSYVAVDYAIVGSLSEDEQFQIGKMLLAVISKNFSEVAAILIGAKWVDPSTRQNELERTIVYFHAQPLHLWCQIYLTCSYSFLIQQEDTT